MFGKIELLFGIYGLICLNKEKRSTVSWEIEREANGRGLFLTVLVEKGAKIVF